MFVSLFLNRPPCLWRADMHTMLKRYLRAVASGVPQVRIMQSCLDPRYHGVMRALIRWFVKKKSLVFPLRRKRCHRWSNRPRGQMGDRRIESLVNISRGGVRAQASEKESMFRRARSRDEASYSSSSWILLTSSQSLTALSALSYG
jgi:hypothetical protein